MPFFSKKAPAPAPSSDAFEALRNDWLGGKMAALAPPSEHPEDPIAVLMERGMGGDTATFVAADDGTASMYLSTGGGIIGMGFHPLSAASALALVGCGAAYVELFAKASAFPLPKPGIVAFHVVTRAGVHSAYLEDQAAFDDPDVGPLRAAGELLTTNARLMDEQRRAGPIEPGTMLVHVFPDGGVCLFAEPNPEAAWLTTGQLRRALEIGRDRGDSLAVDVERGTASLQAPALAVIEGMARARAPAPERSLSIYSGGTTTLHFAAENARLDLTREQIANGADLEARDDLQYTPLILAAFKNRASIVRVLLEAGADAQAGDRHGNTALHFLAQAGNLAGIARILEAGVDVNARGQNGYTPLAIARLCKQEDAAKLLAANGATQ